MAITNTRAVQRIETYPAFVGEDQLVQDICAAVWTD